MSKPKKEVTTIPLPDLKEPILVLKILWTDLTTGESKPVESLPKETLLEVVHHLARELESARSTISRLETKLVDEQVDQDW